MRVNSTYAPKIQAKVKDLVNCNDDIPNLDTKLSELVGYEGVFPEEYSPIINLIITKN